MWLGNNSCGLVAQWIEHYAGSARSWVRIQLSLSFFRLLFQFKLIVHCEDQISLRCQSELFSALLQYFRRCPLLFLTERFNLPSGSLLSGDRFFWGTYCLKASNDIATVGGSLFSGGVVTFGTLRLYLLVFFFLLVQ